jgi:hypothetical protein
MHQPDATHLRVRKFSPVDRDTALFEVLEGEVVLFDVGSGAEGGLEIAFHEASSNRVLPLSAVEEAIGVCKVMMEHDRDPAA